MAKKSPIVRLLLALWLLSSQIAGAAMVFAPVVVLTAVSSVPGAEDASINFLLALGYILPLFFIGLGIAAWVMFARKRDGASGWLGLATLAPGALMLLAMRLYTG